MKTIKILAAVVVFIVIGNLRSFAQVSKEDADLVRAQFGKEKKQLVSAVMNLSGAKADAFWKVYDAYEADRKKLMDTRLGVLNDYLKNYKTIDDTKASSYTNRAFDSDEAITKMQRSYYPKFAQAVGAKSAAKFYQLDNYLQTIVKLEIQDNIPFIGELDHEKVKH
jgi:glycyl-tRNA synthetase alpha subunit